MVLVDIGYRKEEKNEKENEKEKEGCTDAAPPASLGENEHTLPTHSDKDEQCRDRGQITTKLTRTQQITCATVNIVVMTIGSTTIVRYKTIIRSDDESKFM